MRITRVRGRNFLSFHEFDIAFHDGLTAVVGENRDTPGARSNGSGKSALIDAVSFAAYGQTTRGISGDDVIHREVLKDCMVELHFDDGTVITRHRKDKSYKNSVVITRNGQPIQADRVRDAQEQVDLMLGMDWMTFRQACLFGQDAVRFLGLTDADKKVVIERVLGLELLDQAASIAREECRMLREAAQALERDAAIAQARVEATRKQAASAREHHEKMAKLRASEIESVGREIAALDIEIAQASKRAAKEREEILEILSVIRLDDSRALVEETKALLGETQRLVKEAQESLQGTRQKMVSMASEVGRLMDSIREIEALQGHCPTCLQDVTQSHAHRVIASLRIQVDDQEAKRQACRGLLTQADLQAKACLEAQETATRDHEVSVKNLATQTSQVDLMSGRLERHEQEGIRRADAFDSRRKRLQDRLAGLRSPADGANDSEIVRLDQEASRVKEEVDALMTQTDEFSRVAKDYDFWANGFGLKGMRSMMLDSVFPYLEERINFYLEELTGKTFRLALSPVSAIKNGKEIRESISVVLSASSGSELYDGLSGGERQRVDIAVAIALADLARTRSQARLGFVVFDEVFERLDDAGCEAVGALLRRHAPEWGTVLLVTHLDALLSEVPSRVRVVKEHGISEVKA